MVRKDIENLGDLVKKEWLGPEVVITVEHKDNNGVLHKIGDKANLYIGYTEGRMDGKGSPLVYNKRMPYMGTNNRYFIVVDNNQRKDR